MKSILGHSKNESLELIIGIILNILGGIFIGFVLSAPFVIWNWLLAVGFSISGIILEVRVISKHIYEIGEMRKEVGRSLDLLKQTNTDIQNQKNELEKMGKKTFSGFSSNTSSRPLEDDVQKLHNRLQRIEEYLRILFFYAKKVW